jgi:drug/metabolite transporter (DMT)-like permease
MVRNSTQEGYYRANWLWVLTAFGAHTGWGAYPVLARYLQTVSEVPSFSLIAAGSLTVLIVSGGLIIPKIGWSVFKSRILWIFAVFVFTRAVTNMLAARFTLAIYVQLITLMTPFLVAILSSTLFKDHIPSYTGRSILISLIGVVMIMNGEINSAGMTFDLSDKDWIGIILAISSSFTLAMYMILVRRTASSNIPAEAVFLVQFITLSTVTPVLSILIGENWNQWGELKINDWLVFGAYSILVLTGSNFGQINALRHLGAPMVSSMMPWRLVSALIFGAILLNERLTSPWQIIGAIIVLITITWYLWKQK